MKKKEAKKWLDMEDDNFKKIDELTKKLSRGGAREGAGRPITTEPTVVMRIPISKVEAVKRLIKK
jgi:hypothetical protein